MKTRTEKQDAVQVKFKLACQFLAPLIVFVREGWRKRVKGKRSRPYNVAMSHLIRNAITGVYPTLSIDYGKVLISDGPLVQVSGCNYVRYEDRIELRFEQQPQHDNADDLVTLIAYQVGEYEAACNQRNATRADGQVILHLPEHLKQESLLLYVIICDRNRKVFGRSLYLGESRPA